MLLGCCHCAETTSSQSEPPSESISESLSQSSSGILYFQHPTCQACIDRLYPLVLMLEIPPFGSSSGGSCSEFTGTFFLYNSASSTVYLSDEKVININTGLVTTMTSGPNPATRFTVSYVCSRQIPYGTIQDVELNIRWSLTSPSSAAGLASILYRYTDPGTVSNWDCLQPITLTRVGTTFLTGPCGTTFRSQWPATVTLTPI